MIKIIKIIMLCLLLAPVISYANNDTNLTNSTGNSLFYVDMDKDINIYLVVLFSALAIIIVMFTSKAYIGGMILVIIGFILLSYELSIIPILYIIGGFASVFMFK